MEKWEPANIEEAIDKLLPILASLLTETDSDNVTNSETDVTLAMITGPVIETVPLVSVFLEHDTGPERIVAEATLKRFPSETLSAKDAVAAATNGSLKDNPPACVCD
jgi:hypothetical protein